MIRFKSKYWQWSIALLVASNALVAVIAVLQKWSLADYLWVYWFQSLIIGISVWIRIMIFKFFILGKRDEEVIKLTWFVKVLSATFFALHFGLFVFGYSQIINGFFGQLRLSAVYIAVLTFAVNHFLSLVINYSPRSQHLDKMTGLMISPYFRILPMQFIIFIFVAITFIFRSNGASDDAIFLATLVAFMILKTGADVYAHVIEHSRHLPTGTKIVKLETDDPKLKDTISGLIELDYLFIKKLDEGNEGEVDYWASIRRSCVTFIAKSKYLTLGYINFVAINDKGMKLFKAGQLKDTELEPYVVPLDSTTEVNLCLVAIVLDADFRGLGLAERLWNKEVEYFVKNYLTVKEAVGVIWSNEGEKFMSQFEHQKVGLDSGQREIISLELMDGKLPKLKPNK